MKTRVPIVLAALAIATCALAKVNIFGYWWENPLPYQRTPVGLQSLSAAQCGTCHAEIYREWQASAHAHALSDLQFQAEMQKSPEVAWLCLNCHTPLENQIERITFDVRNRSTHAPLSRANPRFDRALHQEAVTCAVCHVRDGVVLGPYADSKAPHPVRQDRRLLAAGVCTMCHQATAAYTDTLVCTFDTGGEWKAGPYAKRGESCSSCHMPSTERAVASGGPVRTSRRHFFFGSKIPKELHLSEAERQDYALYQPGISVRMISAKRSGGNAVVRVAVKNARAGHLLPTGDPERFIRVEVIALAAGKPVGTQSLRIGQKWEWWPKARKLGDNRLQPLEERVETVELPAPKATAVRVVVYNCRLTQENARYHNLIGRYPLEAKVLELEARPLD
ncbi:MAG TPA: multiheme c-type cytochrome [Bryobacteraceae bacterium]|nr:multiheme c-type cytochrome [Bryobacteraceae bacterium]